MASGFHIYKFNDYSLKVKGLVNEKTERFLEEAASEIESAARRKSRVRSGQLKGSWTHIVEGKEASIGSPLQNAIWEEFGTGEYAEGQGGGRKGGWVYYDPLYGKFHFTLGKRPNRTLQKAFASTKGKIINRAKQIFGELGK